MTFFYLILTWFSLSATNEFAQEKQTLCEHLRITGSFRMSRHTGQANSFSIIMAAGESLLRR